MSAPTAPLVAPARPRSPWQRLYAAALAARRRRLTTRAARLPVPVISIGNLHWGGGGKTPLVIAIARQLQASGRRPAVLSRGYGRRSRGVVVVSRGAGPEVGVDVAGDEPFLIARAVPGLPVVVAERRVEAGRRALAELLPAPDLFLLDDGFSHAALARDLELLVFPAADPFAGGRLLPTGRLREPLTAARHADAVLLGGAIDDPERSGAALAAALAPLGFAGPGFAAPTRARPIVGADGGPIDGALRLFAVAAIARPEGFFAAVRAAGVRPVGTLALPDHDPYAPRTVERLERLATEAGAEALLVTAKDQGKLAGRTRWPVAVLPVEAEPEPAFWRWLDARLGEFGR